MSDYLRIREIGSLFGLDVQTLQYYDKVNIFKPAMRDSNTGYRKYSFDQVYQLAFIRYMRKLGYSIKGIRDFQNNHHPEEAIRRLQEYSRTLHAQWSELMKIDRAIMRKIQYIQDSMAGIDVHAMKILDLPERYYIPIGTEDKIYVDDSFYFYPTVVFYEDDKKYFGALLTENEVETDDIQTKTVVIPAGRYLIAYHQGPYESIRRRFYEMKKAYDLYEFSSIIVNLNIIDQFVEMDSKNYITEIQMRITNQNNSVAQSRYNKDNMTTQPPGEK